MHPQGLRPGHVLPLVSLYYAIGSKSKVSTFILLLLLYYVF